MRDSDRFKLYFGPYATPRFRYGQRVWCHYRGWVKIVGLTDGKKQREFVARGELPFHQKSLDVA